MAQRRGAPRQPPGAWGAAELEAADAPRDPMEPGFWGIEKHSARRILKDLAGTSKPRPRPLPGPPRDRVWAGGPKQPGGLIDPSLRTSSMAAHEAREDLKARWGLQYDPGEFAATSLRPVVPAGALTPAAQRILAGDHHPRSHSTPPGHMRSTGGMLGMIQMRRTTETLPESSWRAVFTDTADTKPVSPGPLFFENTRQDYRTGLYVRAGRASSKQLTASRSLDTLPSIATHAHDDGGDELANKMLAEAGELNVAEFEARVTALTNAFKYNEAVGALTDLRTIRQFVSRAMSETGVLSLLGLMNKACQTLEDAARREAHNQHSKGIQRVSSDEGKTDNLFYWLERLRQHRKFVLEEYEAFQRRPQSVLERALLLQQNMPIVYKNARKVVQKAEKETRGLVTQMNAILSAPKASTGSAVDLAGLKAKVREICLDGSMQTSQSEPVVAAQFRVLVAEIGKRTIQVRKVLLETGIPVQEKVLHELLRRDQSLFPSAFDYGLAKQAVHEAKAALEDLQGSIERDQEIEWTARKERQAAEEKRRAEENELRKIEENEAQSEMNAKVLQTKHARAMEPAIVHPVWEGPCGGSNSGRLGGCVVMHESKIYATCDDNDIWVYDLSTTMFDFCKTYRLRGGHTQTVLSLTVLDGHTLFSGSMDKTVCVWDVERDFALTQVLEGHTDAVTCLAIADCNPGAADMGERVRGKLVCSGSFDTTIRVWEGSEVPLEEEVKAQAVSRADSASSVGSQANRTELSSHETASPSGKVKVEWRCIRTLFGHGCFIHSIITDGKIAYSAGEDGLIKVWDATLKHSIGQLEGCSDSVYALTLRKEAAENTSGKTINHLISSGLDYRINCWDVQQATFMQEGLGQRVLGDISDVLASSFTPDSVVDDARKELANLEREVETAVTTEGKLLLEQGVAKFNGKLDELLKWQATLQFVNSLAVCKDFIYAAGAEDVMRVWSLSMATCVGTVKGFAGVNSMALNGKDEILAVCTRDNKVRVLGTPESATAMENQKADRESSFIKHGGELWTVDLVNDVARLLLPRVHIGQVSCGQKHGIALDSQGGAWSWGASDLGQCGLGTKDDVALPQRIQFFEGNVSTQSLKIKAVSAGWYHSLLLLDTGTAYACGENNIGQLGLEESEESKILFGERESELKKHDALPPGSDKENSWRKIQQIDSAHSVANLVYTPRHVTLGASQKGQDQLAVTAVAAGGRHSIFIDESGVAWACGLATDGQLGLPRDAQLPLLGHDGFFYVREPQQMKNLESVNVVAARASMSHSLLLTNLGRVFSCGSNSDGQLGVGSIAGMPFTEGHCLLLPHLVTGLRQLRVHSLDAGLHHSIFIVAEGDVYACGAKGPTGLPENTEVPKILEPCVWKGQKYKIRLASTSPGGGSGDYSFLSSVDGHAFIAGATPALPEEKSQEPPIKRISSKPTKAPSISTSTPKPQVDNQSQQDEGEGDPAAEEKEEPKKKKKICTIPPRVPPQYHSENGKPWKLLDVAPIGLVPVGPMCRFGDHVPGVQGLNELVVIVDGSCVPFHPSDRAE